MFEFNEKRQLVDNFLKALGEGILKGLKCRLGGKLEGQLFSPPHTFALPLVMMVSWMHKITGYHLFSIKLRTNMTHAIATMVHHASSMRMEDLSTIAAVVGGVDKCKWTIRDGSSSPP